MNQVLKYTIKMKTNENFKIRFTNYRNYFMIKTEEDVLKIRLELQQNNLNRRNRIPQAC